MSKRVLRKQPRKPVKRKPAKSVWVRTFETEDSLYIVIQAKRKPEKA